MFPLKILVDFMACLTLQAHRKQFFLMFKLYVVFLSFRYEETKRAHQETAKAKQNLEQKLEDEVTASKVRIDCSTTVMLMLVLM